MGGEVEDLVPLVHGMANPDDVAVGSVEPDAGEEDLLPLEEDETLKVSDGDEDLDAL